MHISWITSSILLNQYLTSINSLHKSMALPLKVITNETEVDKLLNRVFTSHLRLAYIEVGEQKTCLPITYIDYKARIRKFQIFEDDVFLAGFPKSGTAWCQELIWLIMHDLDFEGATISSDKRYRLLEMAILYDVKIMSEQFSEMRDPFDLVEELERPRCLKTHLPWSLLPQEIVNGSKQPKIIHLSRNPKDSCVSDYHFSRIASGFKGTFEEYCELWLSGRVPYGPYWEYNLSFWNQRHQANILFIKYEEMINDLPTEIQNIARFLNKTIQENDMEKLLQHLSYESIKNNPSIKDEILNNEIVEMYGLDTSGHQFFRSRNLGQKIKMSPEMDARFSAWIEKNTLETDYKV